MKFICSRTVCSTLFTLFTLITFLLIALPLPTSAQVVSVKNDGEMIVKVLSYNDELTLEIPKPSGLEVKNSTTDQKNDGTIAISKSENKISMSVDTGGSVKNFNFEDINESLVEIEERPQTQKVIISTENGRFVLTQKGIKALTDFPININSKSARISVETQTGDRVLAVLPYQAIEGLLKAKIINKLEEGGVELVEEENELNYLTKGERILNLFGFYRYAVPITASVSATTGEIGKVEAPIWWKLLGFMFNYQEGGVL